MFSESFFLKPIPIIYRIFPKIGNRFPHPRKCTVSGGAETVHFRTPLVKLLKNNDKKNDPSNDLMGVRFRVF
mgnify:CR=1 FL=1